MNLDVKHAVGAVAGGILTLLLAAGLGYLNKQGIDVKCPAPQASQAVQ